MFQCELKNSVVPLAMGAEITVIRLLVIFELGPQGFSICTLARLPENETAFAPISLLSKLKKLSR